MGLLKPVLWLLVSVIVSGCYFDSSIVRRLESGSSTAPETQLPVDPGTPSTPVVPGPVATLSGASYLKVNFDYNFDITLSAPHSSDITINYETQDGTALAPMNYLPNSGSIVIPAGNTTAQISLRTTDKFDSVGTFKNFKLKLISTSAGTLDQPEKTINVGMQPVSSVSDIYDAIDISYVSRCLITTSNQLKCWSGSYIASPTTNTEVGTGFSKLALSTSFKCIVTSGGGVKCIGANFGGQLGSGNTTDSYNALVDAVGLSSGVSDITLGGNHACALMTNGTVRCWGVGSSGQLGLNSTSNTSTPTAISGLTGVTKISAGLSYTCALLGTGGLKCWGLNATNQLGDNTAVNKLVPTDVNGLTSGVLDVYTGNGHTCAKLTGNTVRCWGLNSKGQLGDGSTTNRATPVNVTSLTNVSSVDLGANHTCAVLTGGAVRCWGNNSGGQLGDGTLIDRSSFVSVTGLPATASKLSLGIASSCALLTTGTLYCWGSHGGSAELGDGEDDWVGKYPRKVTTLGSNIIHASRGRSHTCVVTSAGAAKCWGYNFFGQLGDNTTTNRPEPITVSGLSSGVLKVSAGGRNSCALLTGGAVQCWGSGFAMGDSTFVSKYVPTNVTGLGSGVNDIQTGQEFSCALLNTGGVKCWGSNTRGQLGDGTFTARSAPVDVQGLTSGVASISVGAATACAKLTGGTIKCWGQNEAGQLGDGTTNDSNTPLLMPGITSASKVSVAQTSICLLLTSGAVKCIGYNFSGELGDDTYTDSTTLVDVLGLQSGVVDIVSGGEDYSDYSCALTNAGVMKCWGNNSYNQIVANPSATNYSKPTDIVGVGAINSLVKGCSANNCIINTSNELFCWGFNDQNQSRGALTISPQPVLMGHDEL